MIFMLSRLTFVFCSLIIRSTNSYPTNSYITRYRTLQNLQRRLLIMKKTAKSSKKSSSASFPSSLHESEEVTIKSKSAEISNTLDNDDIDNASSPIKNKRPKLDRPDFPRDTLVSPSLSVLNNQCIKICVWNTAGLRALIKNHKSKLIDFFNKHDPDIFCIQETKLQEEHVKEHELIFEELGYSSIWTCSTGKKGYSGVVVLFKMSKFDYNKTNNIPSANVVASGKKAIQSKLNFAPTKSESSALETTATESLSSSSEMKKVPIINTIIHNEDAGSHDEGRMITVEFPTFYLVTCYVPNSGEGLKRLDYRIDQWDPFFRNYLNSLKIKKPVVVAGDLNVAHLDLDIYNCEAKHISKQAGLTPQERQSFGKLLQEGYTDALRWLYPDAKGQFTYWSKRTSAYDTNSGLRIDYFLCSNNMFPTTAAGGGGATHGATSTAHNSESAAGSDSDNTDSSGRRVTVEVDKIPSPGVYDYISLHSDPLAGCSDHCPIMLVVNL